MIHVGCQFSVQHGVLIENMNDTPYVRRQHLTPETVAIMTRVCSEVRKIIPKKIPCGVQVISSNLHILLLIPSVTHYRQVEFTDFGWSKS